MWKYTEKPLTHFRTFTAIVVMCTSTFLQSCAIKFHNSVPAEDETATPPSESSSGNDPSDTTPPTLAITAPNSGNDFSTNTQSQTISGTCSTDAINLGTTLGTFSDSDCSDGTWALNAYNLNAGVNTFTINAEDAAGNPITDSLAITYDTTAPTLAVTAPNSGNNFSTNTQSQTVSGTCTTDAINLGTTLGTFSDSDCSDGTWALNAYNLNAGVNTFTINAEDAVGNPVNDSLTITYDTTAPTLTITAPNAGANFTTTTQSQTVSGTCTTDAINLTSSIGTFSDSDCSNGTWALNAYSLSVGVNTFTVGASDAAGNTTNDAITITYSTAFNQLDIPSGGTKSRTQWDAGNGWLEVDASTNVWTLTSIPGFNTTGLRAYYRLNEGTMTDGATIQENANGISGTLHTGDGANKSDTGKLNDCVHLDGTDDYISVTDPGAASALDFANASTITLTAWVRADSITGNERYTVLTKGGTAGNGQWNYKLLFGSGGGGGGLLSFYYTSAVGPDHVYQSSEWLLEQNRWYFIAFTYTFGTGSTAKLYVNGQNVPGSWITGTGNASPYNNDQDLWIGAANYSGANTDFMDGKIDEVTIWNRALSAAELYTLYDYQSPTYSGTFISGIIDKSFNRTWETLEWETQKPTLKNIPNNAGAETTYGSGIVANNANIEMLLHLDGSAGNIANNASVTESGGNTLTATAKNTNGTGMAYGTGRLNNGIIFDGTDDRVEIADPGVTSALDFANTEAITISMWINARKINNNTYNTLLQKSHLAAVSYPPYGLELESAIGAGWARRFNFYYNNGSGGWNVYQTTNDVYMVGEWTHLAVTYTFGTGASIKTYVNGALQAGSWVFGAGNQAPNQTNDPVMIGGGCDNTTCSQFFDGTVDEVAIYRAALTATEVKDLYHRGALRLKLQIMSCDDAACAGESFVGPASSTSAYFTELLNSSLGLPSINISGVVIDNRYFRYKAVLDTDDASASPELKSVTISGQ